MGARPAAPRPAPDRSRKPAATSPRLSSRRPGDNRLAVHRCFLPCGQAGRRRVAPGRSSAPAGRRVHASLSSARGGRMWPAPGEVAECFLRLDGMGRRTGKASLEGVWGVESSWDGMPAGPRSAYLQGGRQSALRGDRAEQPVAGTAPVPGQHTLTGKPGKPVGDRAPGGAPWVRDSGCTHARLTARQGACNLRRTPAHGPAAPRRSRPRDGGPVRRC